MGKKSILMVHAGKSTKLKPYVSSQRKWRNATEGGSDLKYIQRLVSIMYETHIDPKEMRNKLCVKNFQQG